MPMAGSPTPDSPTRGGPMRGPRKVDPADRAQLAESPVSWRRVGSLFAPFRGRIAIVVALIVSSSLVSLASPFLLRLVIDDALPQQDVRLLLLVVGGMLAVTVATAVLGLGQTLISTRVGQEVMHRLRTDVFSHLQRQSLSFFTRTRGGEVQSRLTNDVAGMQSVVTSTATSIASNVTTAVGTAIAMVALSWRLSLLSLLVIPPAIWLTRRVALLRRDVTAKQQRRMADMLTQVDEGLSVSGVQLTKTLGATETTSARFASTSRELVDLEVQSQLAGRWRMATMSVVFAAIPALIYLAAGFPATSGGMTIGTLVAFTALQSGIFRPLMGLLDVGVSIVSSMALFSRIFGYIDLEVEVKAPAYPVAVEPAAVRGEVRIEGVTYRYPDADRDALAGVDLVVPAGTSLALVGETGSGKTTLASLVPRLRDPSVGRVLVDGIDLRDLTHAALAAAVAVVPQSAFLFDDTVRGNVTLGSDHDDAEVWEALRIAQADGFVAALPHGLDTRLGERGTSLSGGQRQRISLARALVRHPRLLILDDATSAVDPEVEARILGALRAGARDSTLVVVAYRKATIGLADEVVHLEDGRVAERGPHADLLVRSASYARLVNAYEQARESAGESVAESAGAETVEAGDLS